MQENSEPEKLSEKLGYELCIIYYVPGLKERALQLSKGFCTAICILLGNFAVLLGDFNN